MFAYRWKSLVLKEIGVGEDDGNVRFYTGSRSNAASCMRIGKYAISPLFMAELPKISASCRKSGSRRTVVNINDRKFFDFLEQVLSAVSIQQL